ncbi:hypothetical protein POL68_23275 [Stigmatella sp. ncwal1]|uniref:Uncharacterized protein n=1 Tax=Stigmatella ashevillensis TaxID=2995309 RepID=A0ABT5DCL9_9BACT|nr:hypothetical protein [Stigmatella ashevillena]MDC0711412.1 hypothetical protein [Stigmatella ashevillena]
MGTPSLDAWPFIMQLVYSGINPAMLEAYSNPNEISALPDSPFFQEAVEAVKLAHQVLGADFDALSMERKIALLGFIRASGPDAFSQKFKTGGRTSEALEALVPPRLVFPEPSLNQLRNGEFLLMMASTGPAVRYLHRHLQVSERILETPRTVFAPFDTFHFATGTAIRQFEEHVFQKSEHLRSKEMSLGSYTLGFLELIVFFAKAPPVAKLSPAPAGMLIFKKKTHLIKTELKDFDAFMELRKKLWLAHTSPPKNETEDKDPLALSEDDLKKFKYLLAYVQEGHTSELNTLKALAGKLSDQAKKYAEGAWEETPIGAKVAIISVPALLAGYSLYRHSQGTATAFDQTFLGGLGSLMAQAPFNILSPKKSAGFQTQPTQLSAKGFLEPLKRNFSFPQAKPVESKGLSWGGSLTFNQHKRLPTAATPQVLKANGFSDPRVWYCEKTCGTYRTDELRVMVQRGELTLTDQVMDLTSDGALTELSSIPMVAAQKLYSTAEKTASATLEYHSTFFRGQPEAYSLPPFHVKAQGEWKNWTLAAAASSKFEDFKNPADDETNPDDDKITGFVRDLEFTVRRKLLAGLNTPSRTSQIDLWGTLKDSQVETPLSQLNKHTLVTTAGVRWDVVRRDKNELSFSLAGSVYPDTPGSAQEDRSPELDLHTHLMNKKLTLSLDAKLLLKKEPQASSVQLHFFYNLGGKR